MQVFTIKLSLLVCGLLVFLYLKVIVFFRFKIIRNSFLGCLYRRKLRLIVHRSVAVGLWLWVCGCGSVAGLVSPLVVLAATLKVMAATDARKTG